VARNNGFSSADTREATMAPVTAYREALASFAQMRTMDIWYAHLDEDELMKAVRGVLAETAQEAKKGPKGATLRDASATCLSVSRLWTWPARLSA
jgi:hypothetical protein